MLIGSLLILGYFPGPTLFEQQTEIVGGIFLVYLAASILAINVVLLAAVGVIALRRRKSTRAAGETDLTT